MAGVENSFDGCHLFFRKLAPSAFAPHGIKTHGRCRRRLSPSRKSGELKKSPAAGGGPNGGNAGKRAWIGLEAAPAPRGTVVPAAHLPTRTMHATNLVGMEQ